MTSNNIAKRVGASLGLIFMTAMSVATVAAATLSQDFNTQQQYAQGTIVSLDKQASEVIQASIDNSANLYGVVVRDGDLSFDQGTDTNSGTVPVANAGVVDTLVSNNNGSISPGDPITVDDVAGVGQKATRSGKIIGIAQSPLNEQDTKVKTVSITQNGSQKNIIIGTVQVKIEVTDYVLPSNGDDLSSATENRNKVMQVADSLAGKQVKPISIVVAGLILLITIFVSIFLVTSSGYASMISIGRNPLSEKKIIQSLVRLLLIAVGIFVAGLLLSYAILRLV